ncbi:Aste57867_16524 [Aphanomyces stellatus]|uniref:Aste57867_16524 protein n=1 Tax=Aphanomyces stellatus TaxID=120398 RepID=A0A485L6W0_9STRA|nr:hypothetical protein As57867_016467 [Aphanomyces stellatus]VFT93298.1 Aste57867_16524 [Aphanomyces stellatus]
MQFATTSSSSSLTSWTVLTQPLVDDDTAWSFYGWLFVYDWVHGRRFVVSLEGDASTQVLVSAIAAPTLFPSTGGSGLTHATRVIYYLSVYMSAVLAVVAVASLVVHAVNRASTDAGDNWFFFNRVAGSIWVGRPLLVNRALSAMLILSTAQVALDGSTHFVFAPRPWIDTLVVAGETTWLAYVIVDACHVIVAPGHTKAYAPWGTALAWSIIVVIELAAPIQPVGALRRECTSTNMDMAIACSGSVVQVGNLARLATLMGMQLGSLVVAAVGVYFWNQRRRHSGLSTQRQRHVLAIADEFFAVRESPTDAIWAMDPVSCVVAGLVPFKLGGTRYTFDVKFWVVVPDTYSLGAMKRFVSNAREVKVKHRSSLLAPVGSFGPSHVSIRQAAATAAVAGGVLYTVAAIVGSILYIQVAKVNLANDLSWAKFSMAGTHTFLANLLNERLVLGIDDTRLALDDGRYAMVGGDTGASSTVVSPANFGARLAASKLNTRLADVVAGLRRTDACLAPWIFTQYCYVDLGRQWELANSAARQARCAATMQPNGAVYLETILRNVDYAVFRTCWGDAFDVAIGRELAQTAVGLSWLDALTTLRRAVADEVMTWQHHGITSFDVQWQNFKRVGLVNTYSIVNAYGGEYALTLQAQPMSFQLAKQTMFKMYWGFASDLFAVAATNDTTMTTNLMHGRSLVRSSASFAFSPNGTTIAAVLMANGTIHTPLSQSLALVTSFLGPLGSIDLVFVPCPRAVTAAVAAILDATRLAVTSNTTAETTFVTSSAAIPNGIYPAPTAWVQSGFLAMGGSPLCAAESFQAAVPIGYAITQLFGFDSQCTVAIPPTSLAPTFQSTIAAVVLAQLGSSANTLQPADVCACDQADLVICVPALTSTIAFVSTYLNVAALAPVVDAASTAMAPLHVQFFQLGQLDAASPLAIFTHDVLDATDPAFDYYAWLFLYDWALGQREAVTFQGDVGTTTLLSEYLAPLNQAVNLAETPNSLAPYVRSIVNYVTGVMISLSLVALTYVAVARGRVEVLNLLELNRVGAIVWVGRPLLLARALTALSLLSTSTLQLVVQSSGLASFSVPTNAWYKTVLAANEVTWLAAVVNDVALVFTQEYTLYFITPNSILVWLITVATSFAAPVGHDLRLAKSCAFGQVDFDVVCASATLTIGYLPRLALLCGIVVGCTVVSYVTT